MVSDDKMAQSTYYALWSTLSPDASFPGGVPRQRRHRHTAGLPGCCQDPMEGEEALPEFHPVPTCPLSIAKSDVDCPSVCKAFLRDGTVVTLRTPHGWQHLSEVLSPFGTQGPIDLYTVSMTVKLLRPTSDYNPMANLLGQ